MINDIQNDADARMHKSLDSLKNELSKLRTSRAHPSLLEQVTVDYYGNQTPMNQVASINIADARTLTVTPWEKALVPVVEKAIIDANLGLNPASAGDVIRVPMPPLSEERRKDLVKIVRGEVENARVAIRNIRRDANSQLKDLLKEKSLTEDEERKAQDHIQKLTNKFIAEADKMLEAKEAELMEV